MGLSWSDLIEEDVVSQQPGVALLPDGVTITAGGDGVTVCSVQLGTFSTLGVPGTKGGVQVGKTILINYSLEIHRGAASDGAVVAQLKALTDVNSWAFGLSHLPSEFAVPVEVGGVYLPASRGWSVSGSIFVQVTRTTGPVCKIGLQAHSASIDSFAFAGEIRARLLRM